jgi:hypothetical protein
MTCNLDGGCFFYSDFQRLASGSAPPRVESAGRRLSLSIGYPSWRKAIAPDALQEGQAAFGALGARWRGTEEGEGAMKSPFLSSWMADGRGRRWMAAAAVTRRSS